MSVVKLTPPKHERSYFQGELQSETVCEHPRYRPSTDGETTQLTINAVASDIPADLSIKDKEEVKPADQETGLELSFYHTLISAQLSGVSSLPYALGLSLENYQALLVLLSNQESGQALIEKDRLWHATSDQSVIKQNKSNVLNELIGLRQNEKEDVVQLLLKHKSHKLHFTDMAATVIATACLSPAHLWKSLGFETRGMLSEWIAFNFPALHAKNNKGMRWKRFFYLQLCQQGGDYVCRAPSCEECSSFSDCFLQT